MLPIDILRRANKDISEGTVDLVSDSVIGTQYAQWTIGFDGFTYERHNSGAANQDTEWISPQTGMGEFECRAVLTSGNQPPGTFNTWLSLDNSWTWGWVAPQPLEKSCEITITIRRKDTLAEVDAALITLFVSGTS